MPVKKDDLQDDYYSHIQKADAGADATKKPVKLKLKGVVKKPLETEEEHVEPQTTPEETVVPPPERPKARLVEREHASEGLLRSVMNRKVPETPSPREEKKKPAISFSKTPTTFKPLENRPVMQLPPEESRRPRRNGETGTRSAPSQNANNSGRLRDDVKPMFQRDIGYATPTRDGTAKKSGKKEKGSYSESENRRR